MNHRIAIVAGVGLLGAVTGCVTTQGVALQRASYELACPPEQLTVRNRTEISDGIFDVAGCERIVRYDCFPTKYATQCVREPDPDPAEEAARRQFFGGGPAPEAASSQAGDEGGASADGRSRRVCRDAADFRATRTCIMPPAAGP